MIDIEVKRAKHGRTIKIYCRNDANGQPPVTATVMKETLHLYSHADMTHEDWQLLAEQIAQVIAEIKKRNGEVEDDTTTNP